MQTSAEAGAARRRSGGGGQTAAPLRLRRAAAREPAGKLVCARPHAQDVPVVRARGLLLRVKVADVLHLRETRPARNQGLLTGLQLPLKAYAK